MAERLCAEGKRFFKYNQQRFHIQIHTGAQITVESDDSVFMLATCYYRSNQVHQAYWVLHARSSKSPQCRYLLAKCAFELKK